MKKRPPEESIVIFGAGKIGRSFIGQLFSRSGYQVVFIDVDLRIINELNRRKKYDVVIRSENDKSFEITNVCGISVNSMEEVVDVIARCSLMATCVGKNVLPKILPLIAKGIEKRFTVRPGFPLDIILAENIRDSCTFIKNGLTALLSEGFPVESYLGFIETSIGKMVPIMPIEIEKIDPLLVYAEPYNMLILDKNGFKNSIPRVIGLSAKGNIKAWVDRKAFIHNLGHATAAYLGYLTHPTSAFLYEVLSDSQLKKVIRNTMLQAAYILLKKYPDEFTFESLTDHIDDLLKRFQNKALGDTIFRVGCDLQRKLGSEDRLAGAIHLARELKLPYHLILKALVSGCHFNATDEAGNRLPADREFSTIYAKGIKSVLTSICGFDEIADLEVILEAIVLDSLI